MVTSGFNNVKTKKKKSQIAGSNSMTANLNMAATNNASVNSGQQLNEFYEDSNDSSTIVESSNENDAYKIRLEQQKIFLLHNNNEDESNAKMTTNPKVMDTNSSNRMCVDDPRMDSNNNNNNNNNNNSSGNTGFNLNNIQEKMNDCVNPANGNNASNGGLVPSSILVPLGDLQNLNCILPIRTIQVTQFTNGLAASGNGGGSGASVNMNGGTMNASSGDATFKIIANNSQLISNANANGCLNGNGPTTTNIYSLDSVSGSFLEFIFLDINLCRKFVSHQLIKSKLVSKLI